MNVLILGKGFIGQKLHNSLLDKDVASDCFSKAKLDYTNHWKLVTYLTQNPTDIIINASGYTGVPNIDAAEND